MSSTGLIKLIQEQVNFTQKNPQIFNDIKKVIETYFEKEFPSKKHDEIISHIVNSGQKFHTVSIDHHDILQELVNKIELDEELSKKLGLVTVYSYGEDYVEVSNNKVNKVDWNEWDDEKFKECWYKYDNNIVMFIEYTYLSDSFVDISCAKYEPVISKLHYHRPLPINLHDDPTWKKKYSIKCEQFRASGYAKVYFSVGYVFVNKIADDMSS